MARRRLPGAGVAGVCEGSFLWGVCMHYVVSDIHGCYERYMALLERIGLGDSDTLYVLGDMLDRGPDGLRVLQDAVSRPNVVPLMGNHEYAAMRCLLWLMEEVTEENTEQAELAWRLKSIQAWLSDGGEVTLEAFRRLPSGERLDVLDSLADLPLYAEVAAGGQDFVLVHAGLDGFSPSRPLADYGLNELVLGCPDPDGVYFEDRFLVFGHTPTGYFFEREGVLPQEKAGIFRKGRLIGVDCGCVFGGWLGCLCLDDFREFYV